MRTIKFRAFRKGVMYNVTTLGFNESGIQKDMCFAHAKNNPLLEKELNEDCVMFSHDDIFMQFTGLTDKNGVEIYEGDVFGNENMPNRFVVFEDGKFCFNMVHSQGSDSLSQDRVGRIEVIGNIHDNPTLIK